jgi:hypothetical protein
MRRRRSRAEPHAPPERRGRWRRDDYVRDAERRRSQAHTPRGESGGLRSMQGNVAEADGGWRRKRGDE